MCVVVVYEDTSNEQSCIECATSKHRRVLARDDDACGVTASACSAGTRSLAHLQLLDTYAYTKSRISTRQKVGTDTLPT